MEISRNYDIGEVLKEKQTGALSESMRYLYEEIKKYECRMKQQIITTMEQLRLAEPENPMRWITENTDRSIQYYCRCELLGNEYHVLKKSANHWKKISDIGIQVMIHESVPADHSQWVEEWQQSSGEMAKLQMPVYETHAHYNLNQFDSVREELIPLLRQAGISHCIIPAIEFQTCYEIKALFDGPEYDWVTYAFGSHPKYLWKEKWTEEKWEQLHQLAEDPKCIAIGEAGLDYSYGNIDVTHRENQMYFFRSFLEIANQHHLPLVLHFRAGEEGKGAEFDVTEDSLAILRECPPAYGAVMHCFGGTSEEFKSYLEAGVTHFGIGARICRGIQPLEKAVAEMPEKALLLETDAPYIRLKGDFKPNTSLTLLKVAEKIAELRGTTTEHIFEITYQNAVDLFHTDTLTPSPKYHVKKITKIY